jgi:hypothetical protein
VNASQARNQEKLMAQYEATKDKTVYKNTTTDYSRYFIIGVGALVVFMFVAIIVKK